MRRSVLRCLLPAFFAVLSAVPAAASPINVGSFYFFGDEFFEYFVFDNNANGSSEISLQDLTFFARLTVDGVEYDVSEYGDGDGVLAAAEYADTNGLAPFGAFSNSATASLEFYGGNFSERGTLFADPLVSPNVSSAAIMFEATVTEPPTGVPEHGSILVVAIGLSALVVGRALLS